MKLILYVIHRIYFSDGSLCQYPLYRVFQRTELIDIAVCHGYVAGEYLSPEKGKFRIVGNTQIPTDRIAENAVHDGQTLLYRLFVVVIFNRAGFIVFQIGTIRIDFPVINALFLEIFLKGLVSKHDTDGTDFTHRGSDKGSAGGGSQPEMGTPMVPAT